MPDFLGSRTRSAESLHLHRQSQIKALVDLLLLETDDITTLVNSGNQELDADEVLEELEPQQRADEDSNMES